MTEIYRNGPIELRLGDWREVLADVEACDAVITDPPYSERTHAGHGSFERWGTTVPKSYDGSRRSEIEYDALVPDQLTEFAFDWGKRCRGRCAVMCDDNLIVPWRNALETMCRTGFQDVPCVIRGMTVRQSGDGPSSWAVHLVVSRPPRLSRWGTLPGAYVGPSERCEIIGGKPLWLMRALIRDYTRPGDLVVDPYAGGGTTLLAAAMEGRRCIGAECDPSTFAKAVRRLSAGWTTYLFNQGENR